MSCSPFRSSISSHYSPFYIFNGVESEKRNGFIIIMPNIFWRREYKQIFHTLPAIFIIKTVFREVLIKSGMQIA